MTSTIILQTFIPLEEEALLECFFRAASESQGTWDTYKQGEEFYFSIPTGNLSGVDFYIQILEASGLWWSLLRK